MDSMKFIEDYAKFIGWRKPVLIGTLCASLDKGHSTKEGASAKATKARRKKNKNKKTHRRTKHR